MPAAAGAVRTGWLRLRRSVQWRLVALFVLLALATTVVFVAGTRQWLQAGWRELGRPLVRDYVDRLAAEVGSPPSVARAEAITRRLPLSIRIDGPQVVWDSQAGQAVSHWQEGRHGAGMGSEMRALLTRQTADGHRLVFGIGDWGWDGAVVPGSGWRTLLGLLLLTTLAYAYIWRLLRPLDEIRLGALRFGAGRFGPPIPVHGGDELGELARQVNTMATNLQRMLDGQRGLLLAISHELRSPLTRARINAELVPEGPERDALLRDLAEMRELISDLLEGERLAAGAPALQLEPTALAELVREMVASQYAGRDITLDLTPALPPLGLDRSRMRLLLRNLIGNALRHGGATPVHLSLAEEAGAQLLTVRDHGPGVAPEQLPQLAQPFYRPDAARSRAQGGVGLGLYLCRLVAESHGGSLGFEAAAPGLRATVRLPLDMPSG